MLKLIPVDHDPFATSVPAEPSVTSQPKFTPIDYDPFVETKTPLPESSPLPDETIEPVIESTGGRFRGAGAGGNFSGLSDADEESRQKKIAAMEAFYGKNTIPQLDIVQNLTTGIYGTAEGMAGMGQRLGSEKAKDVADEVSAWRQSTAKQDPDFIDDVQQGAGSMMTFLVPGITAGKTASLLMKYSPKVAGWIASLTATGLEAGTEAGSVYREMLEKGASEEKAKKASNYTFGANAVLVGITNKLGLFGEEAKAFQRAVTSSLMEGGQEYGQEVISDLSTGEGFDHGRAAKSGLIGMAVGGPASIVTGGGMADEMPFEKAPFNEKTKAAPETDTSTEPPTLTPVEHDPFKTEGVTAPLTADQDAAVADLLRKNPDMTMNQARDTVLTAGPEIIERGKAEKENKRMAELEGKLQELKDRFEGRRVGEQPLALEVQSERKVAPRTKPATEQPATKPGPETAPEKGRETSSFANAESLDPSTAIGNTTLQGAVQALARGDLSVLPDVQAGVDQYGKEAMQDRIGNLVQNELYDRTQKDGISYKEAYKDYEGIRADVDRVLTGKTPVEYSENYSKSIPGTIPKKESVPGTPLEEAHPARSLTKQKESEPKTESVIPQKKKKTAEMEDSKEIKIYRGETAQTKSGRYYSPDKDFAVQFTQTGQEKELKSASIPMSKIYKPDVLPEATNAGQVDNAIKEAKEKGFDAVWMDEGKGQSDSIYIVNKSILKKKPMSKAELTAKVKTQKGTGDISTKKNPQPEGGIVEKRVISKEAFDKAQASLKGKLSGLKSGIDPTVIKELAVIGAYHIESGIRNFKTWSDLMVKNYGEKIKPHLKTIWNNSKKLIANKKVKAEKAEAVEKVRVKAEEKIPPETPKPPKGVVVERDYEGTFELPEETRLEGFRRNVEDFNIRLKVLNKGIEEAAGSAIEEHHDLWAQKDMLPRHTSDVLRRIHDDKVDFVTELTEADIDVEALDKLLHAQHAAERNAEMNRKRRLIGQEPIEGLSGMENEEAAEIIAAASPELKGFAERARKIAADTLNFELAEGLITQEEYDIYKKTYKNYVPLFRDMGESDFTGIGAGVDIKGPESKRAKGSADRRVVSPLGNVFYRAEKAQIRALKNEVGKTVIDMVEKYPFLKDIFKIEKEPMVKVGTATHTAVYDPEFQEKLVKLAKGLGLNAFITSGKVGRTAGYYQPGFKAVTKHVGAGRETEAHEVGHFFDYKYGLKDRFYINRKASREVGKEMQQHMINIGQSKNRQGKPEERFAHAFEWWLTHRDLAEEQLPLFSEAMQDIIKEIPDLKPLLKIRPTGKMGIEATKEDIWGRVMRLGENVIGAKIDGRQHYITITDPKIAAALKNTNLARIPKFVRFLRSILGIWSGFKTRWRPEFIVTNFQRDLGEALTNLGVEAGELGKEGKGLRREIAKNVFQSQRQIWRYLRKKSDWRVVDEFFKLGGDTGHFWMETAMDAEKSLEKMQEQIKGEGVQKLISPVRIAGQWIDDVNTMVELGVRFSAYKALVKRGMSKKRAIQSAADLTVNFSRQGELSPLLKSAYGFINPAIQGSSKVIRSLTSKQGRYKVGTAVTGLVALGFITRLISQLIDEDGDDAMNEWSKNNKWAFSVNGKHVTLWSLPYGFSTFYATGSNLAEWMLGKKTGAEATKSILNSAIDSFSPFDTNLNSLIPTLAKPIYEINQNNAWYEGPIYPDQVFTRTPKADYESYFKSTGRSEKMAAKALYEMSNGLIDVHPGSMKYAYNQYFGGPFEFTTSTIEAAVKGLDGEFDPNETPFVRQVYRESRPQHAVYGVINDTLEKAWMSDISVLEKHRFTKAVDRGRKEQLFISETDKPGKTDAEIQAIVDKKADGYIQDFYRARQKMEGPILDKENIKKMAAMPTADFERLRDTYSERTRIKLDAGVSAWRGTVKQDEPDSKKGDKVREFFLKGRK